jgi:choline TMA-lyase-activating enzyme
MGSKTSCMLERKARIFNIQKYSIYDGPGIRTLVFFKGCPLRCRWCSNPEGLERKYQVMFQEELCIHCGQCVSVCPVHIHYLEATAGAVPRHKLHRDIDCKGCHACEDICPKQALSVVGKDMTISEVLDVVLQDDAFYRNSGGGITLSGGEVTMQPEFAVNLLMECKMAGIHTAIETCGYAKLDSLLQIAQFNDLFLFDIKQIDPEKHYSLTGVRNERILENLTALIQRGHQVKVRMPLIKNLNTDEADIRGAMDFLQPFRQKKNFQGVDLLPYHKLGINKYKQLDKEYSITEDLSLSDADLDRIEGWIADCGLEAKIIRH